MTKELPLSSAPEWLMVLDADAMKKDNLPLGELLDGSLYYPAAGFDGTPVQYCTGDIYSFVYVDYSRPKDLLLEELNSDQNGFKGYKMLSWRGVAMDELVPNGWHPEILPGPDENPRQHQSLIEEPYCIWAIMERSADFDEDHGPKRFSLLYLCADGAASYQALYNSNGFVPLILSIIRPGHAFGGNYTDFTNPQGILARSVKANKKGMPEFLLHEGVRTEGEQLKAIWPDYSFEVCSFGNTGIYVWAGDDE
jgi:hypothetical protein